MTDNNPDYPYYINISIAGLTTSDIVSVVISDESISVAQKAYISSTQTSKDVLRLRARYIPLEDINAYYYILASY